MKSLLLGGAVLFVGMAAASAQQTTLEVIATQPEYLAQDTAIWAIYQHEHPDVKIDVTAVNEDTEAAYQARVAGGDPADIRSTVPFATKDNYKTYYDVKNLGCVHWDLFTYDARHTFRRTDGIDYQPTVNVRDNPFRSFVYNEDVMRKAGLHPKSIRTLKELDDFLAKLKAYVDKDPKLENVLGAGYLPAAWGRFNNEVWAMGFGATKQQIRDLYLGKIAWTDKAHDPMVPYFRKLHEWYKKGYMPRKWWERNWEQEFEASFISGRTALVFHGPWIFDKVLAQKPDAHLNGFFFPPNKEGKVWGPESTSNYGSALYSANVGKPDFQAAKDAFCWWVSPKTVKLRAEAIGFVPAMDLSSVGGADLQNPQYVKVVRPVLKGKTGFTFDQSLCGMCVAAKYRVPGTPEVMQDPAMAGIYGDYLTDKMSLDQVLAWLQARWDRAYDIPKGGAK